MVSSHVARGKFFVCSLPIATMLYKYMHIYLWTALRNMVLRMVDLRMRGWSPKAEF